MTGVSKQSLITVIHKAADTASYQPLDDDDAVRIGAAVLGYAHASLLIDGQRHCGCGCGCPAALEALITDLTREQRDVIAAPGT